MQRRKVLKIGGAAATAATTGVLGALFASQGASATAGSNISNPSTVTTDDGRIKWVSVQSTGRLTWDGFDEPATYGRILTRVELKRDGSTLFDQQIHDSGKFDLRQSDWGGSGEDVDAGQQGYIAADVDWGICQRDRQNIYNNGYGLPENPAPVDDFYANEDGTEQRTKVVLTSTYLLYDENENELTGRSEYPARPTASSSFTVTVNNETADTGFGGGDAEGDTDDSAGVGTDTPTPTSTPS